MWYVKKNNKRNIGDFRPKKKNSLSQLPARIAFKNPNLPHFFFFFRFLRDFQFFHLFFSY